MFFRRSEQKRTHPYVALTIGTLAMIGTFSVVRCTKRTAKTMCGKMTAMFKSDDECTACE